MIKVKKYGRKSVTLKCSYDIIYWLKELCQNPINCESLEKENQQDREIRYQIFHNLPWDSPLEKSGELS